MNNKPKQTHTRKINPKLGMLGFFGLLGFAGFVPSVYNLQNLFPVPFLFFFFAFFGFFGFYFEGKMSGTLIDERFETNAYRAAATANRIALCVIILTAIFSTSVIKVSNAYLLSSILIASIGFSFGLAIFLQQYLLYRFENEE